MAASEARQDFKESLVKIGSDGVDQKIAENIVSLATNAVYFAHECDVPNMLMSMSEVILAAITLELEMSKKFSEKQIESGKVPESLQGLMTLQEALVHTAIESFRDNCVIAKRTRANPNPDPNLPKPSWRKKAEVVKNESDTSIG